MIVHFAAEYSPLYQQSVPLDGDNSVLLVEDKQGSGLMRFFLVEAAQVTVRSDPEWRSRFFHLAMRRGRKIAKVAMAR
jgi:hypothetical protein